MAEALIACRRMEEATSVCRSLSPSVDHDYLEVTRLHMACLATTTKTSALNTSIRLRSFAMPMNVGI